MKSRPCRVGTPHLLAASLLALPLSLWAQAPVAPPAVGWKQANEAVAEFPRGHMDVLKWEAQQMPAPATQAPANPTSAAPGLDLLTPAAAVRQAWAPHRDLVKAMNRLGTANVELLAQGRWTEVDPSLQRRVDDAAELLEVAASGRKAWLQAVAARQVLAQHVTALEAAEAANGLGQRMVAVGNWSRLQGTQAQLAETSARANLRRARYAAAQAEAALLQTLQLTGMQTAVQLPDRLPDLPAQPMAQAQLDARSAAIAAQLPRIEAMRHTAHASLAGRAYQDSHALAISARDEVLKTRELIAEETVLHYNGMLKSVWDLLAEVSSQSQAVVGAIDAQRDFWLAEADLQWVLQGGAPTRLVTLGGGSGEPAAPAGH